jgi:hypothetical protein
MRTNTRPWILKSILSSLCLTLILTVYGCSALNLGELLWPKWPKPGIKHWLVKDAKLTGGSSSAQRDDFDHMMFRSVNVIFVPKNEKNHYVSKITWYDPSGTEFRTIRQTHDIQQETSVGEERTPEGSTRVHSLRSKDLYDHKPGRWKVELFLDDELALRFEFTIR